MKKNTVERKYCGNCDSHNAYNYPNQVFCGRRFSHDKNPIVDTLSCCEDWSPSSQECYCVREATKKQG